MFGKLAADVLGLSDIGSVIKPENYDKVESDDFILHEDNEKIYFLIKSKADEYCFTNYALIHLDGTSAVSKKRTLHRYNYYSHSISNVRIETAGTVDLDIEIKFNIGNVAYSIDVNKKFSAEVKDLYKALLKIGEIGHENEVALNIAKESLELSTGILKRVVKSELNAAEQFKALNEAAFDWLSGARKQYRVKDFGPVFEKYINF